MRDRLLCAGLLVLSLVFPLAGCSNPSGLDSISISPTSSAMTVGHTTQFTVTGTYGNASHPTTKIVTTGLTWASSNTAVVTVDQSGLATAVGAGSATVTANAQAFNGATSASADITVTSSGGGGTVSGSITAITITPGAQTISGAGNTVQFTAIGTTSSGSTVNLTSSSAWISSATSVATVGATTGVANSVAAGTTTISALYYDSSTGSTVIGTAQLTVTSAASGAYTSLTIIPSSQSLSASGQTGQFIALGTTSAGLVEDVTDSAQINWQSSIDTIATVDNKGLAKGVSAGSTTITALLTNSGQGAGVVSATATVSVSVTAPPEPLLSLEIIPSDITVNDFNLSGQFIAIGTYSTAPYVRDLTNDVNTTWSSSTPNIFPVSTSTGGLSGASGGIVTAEGSGNATIIAETVNAVSDGGDGTIQTATATFNCPHVLGDGSTPPSCPNTDSGGQILLSTLTIYQRGLNTTNWLVTADSATGTKNVIHCGPGWTGTGGSVCTATYPTLTNGVGTQVVLTAPGAPANGNASGGTFGGWSSNCVPSNADGTTPPTVAPSATGPNYCVITLGPIGSTGETINDDVVGIIVN